MLCKHINVSMTLEAWFEVKNSIEPSHSKPSPVPSVEISHKSLVGSDACYYIIEIGFILLLIKGQFCSLHSANCRILPCPRFTLAVKTPTRLLRNTEWAVRWITGCHLMGKMFCYASNRNPPPRGPTEAACPARASPSADLERCHGQAGSRLGAGRL